MCNAGRRVNCGVVALHIPTKGDNSAVAQSELSPHGTGAHFSPVYLWGAHCSRSVTSFPTGKSESPDRTNSKRLRFPAVGGRAETTARTHSTSFSSAPVETRYWSNAEVHPHAPVLCRNVVFATNLVIDPSVTICCFSILTQ